MATKAQRSPAGTPPTVISHEIGATLWNHLEPTEDRWTKRFDKGNFKGTAVDAVYNMRRVTEALGPVGFAWGWTVIGDKLDHFGQGGDNPTTIHTAIVRAWFRQPDGSTREVDQVGQTIAARMVGRGNDRRYAVDDEYAKKSVTDALSKIMLALGASADIWLGRFDGNKYVPLEQRVEEGEPEADQRAEHEAPRVDPLVDLGRADLRDLPKMEKKAVQTRHAYWHDILTDTDSSRIRDLSKVDRELARNLFQGFQQRAKALGVELPQAPPKAA
jgi:hypothetical protein